LPQTPPSCRVLGRGTRGRGTLSRRGRGAAGSGDGVVDGSAGRVLMIDVWAR